jgi:uncharacterized membrane protein
MLPIDQYILGIIMVAAGMFHFVRPQLYIRIMPPYFPAHSTLVLLSGIAEMVLGFMLLNPETQQLAAWGIIIMLLLFLTVHIHMLRNEEASMKLPKWVLWLRIPLQFLLIYWVYQYT